MNSEVEKCLRSALSGKGLKKKKNGWYRDFPGGLQGIYFEIDRWNSEKVEPLICFCPKEFREESKIPPYYKFPIRDCLSGISCIDWEKNKPIFDGESKLQDRESSMSRFFDEEIHPFLAKLTSTDAAFQFFEDGILHHSAFLMPVRRLLLEKFGPFSLSN